MRRMAMEEPERENIKLPFLQGCKTLCLTKTCTNCNHESLKSRTLFFLHLRTLLREHWHFFPPYSNTTCILWTLCIRILPVLQTGVCCGDVCVNMTWTATIPTVAAKSSMWPQYGFIFTHSKTGILNLFTSGEMVHLWLSKALVGFIFPPLLCLNTNMPPWG